MTKYKIIGTEQPETDGDPVVELRLIKSNAGNPVLKGRNPGGEWYSILFLDRDGKAALRTTAELINGIQTFGIGHIVTY